MFSFKHKCCQVDLQRSTCQTTMKVLVVLILAVFTGCNANLIFADAPTPRLDELSETVWGYFQTAVRTAGDNVQMILESETGQTVSSHITSGAETAKIYSEVAWEQAPDKLKETVGAVHTGFQGLVTKTADGVNLLGEKLKPLTEKIAPVKDSIQGHLSQGAEQVLDLAATSYETVQAGVSDLYDSLVESN